MAYAIFFLQNLLMTKLGKQLQKGATQHITTAEANHVLSNLELLETNIDVLQKLPRAKKFI